MPPFPDSILTAICHLLVDADGVTPEFPLADRDSCRESETDSPMSDGRVMLRYMPDVAHTDVCDCPRDHYRTPDGCCDQPPLWRDDPGQLDRQRYTRCGCCMADCPDVHAEPDPELRIRPGSILVSEEYVATLDAEKQRDLRAGEARGELRIVPQNEMAIGVRRGR